MEKLHSEGQCLYCNKMFTKSGMGRHLATHLKKLEKETPSRKRAYHVNISAAEMFLHLLVDGSSTFDDLDDFLRAIWLECCGHMSSFKVKGKHYNHDWDDITADFGEKKNKKVGTVFAKGLKLEYDYDFGSTTSFEIKVVNEYKITVPEGVLLLSRNQYYGLKVHSLKKRLKVAQVSAEAD